VINLLKDTTWRHVCEINSGLFTYSTNTEAPERPAPQYLLHPCVVYVVQ
jgi:hypothetical protein